MRFPLKYKKLFLLVVILFQTGCFSKRNPAQQKVIQAAALRADFDILRKTLEEAHPGLYWYSDKQDMDSFFDRVKASIAQDMTSIEFFKALLPVIEKIKCLHTNVRLPKNADTETHRFTRLLPFDFLCRKGKLYIRKSFTDRDYDGTEILFINNRETEKILSTLLHCLPADGYNETFKYSVLSNGAFREGYALFFGQPDVFTVRGKDTNNRLHTFTVQAIAPQKISSAIIPSLPPFVLTFRQNTAVLSINTFEIESRKFTDSLESIFQTIKQNGAKHLIIDIRQNGGGKDDNVSRLYSFIATGLFQHLKRAEMIARSLTYSSFILNPKSIARFLNGSEQTGAYLVNGKYAGTIPKNPVHKNLFTGNVVVLTSGNTTSAASEFAAIFHYLQRGNIVGEETGGCYYGATGGNYLNLKLPNSGLEVRIPTIRIFTAVKEDFKHQPKGRGTFPDYQISPTVTDILSKKDVQLDKALEILNH